MMRTHLPSGEKWIHSFAVTDVCLHPKKFTVYKITSVVFPINIPEALTCLTVWKRFDDIKVLLKFIKKRHKSERLMGIVPTLNNHTFFKRFETDVITERKLFIIRLLDFVGQHPQLYKSQIFQDFFNTSQSMPTEDNNNLQFEIDEFQNGDTIDSASNFLSIKDDLNSSTPVPSISSLENASMSSSMSSPIVDSLPDELISDDGYSASTENEVTGQKARTILDNLGGEYSFRSPVVTPSEPNQRKDLSKFRVMQIINNVMQLQDVATNQFFVMKSIDKVFNEPEEFYLPTNFPFMVSLIAYYVSDTTIYLLLEPAIGGRLYDYIRSYNRHSSTTNRTLVKIPQVKLKPLKCGNLIKSNTIRIPQIQSIPKTPIEKPDDDNDLNFYDLLQSYHEDIPVTKTKTNTTKIEDEQSYDEAPHFQLIANDLDVDNILNCSQKLLKSVSKTLKRIQTTTDTEPITPLSAEFQINYNNSIESLNDSVQNFNSIPFSHSLEPFQLIHKMHKSKIENELLLFECIDVNRLPRAIIRRWFREIIFAVKHLHANHILCYDLQPNNLLLGKSGEILLTYFYRREFVPYNFNETMHHTCYPNPYIAPDKPLTAKSDVWSIGIIFYELLTGYSFQIYHPNGMQSYFEIQYPENVELDTASRDLIEGMLQIDPIQRINIDEIEEHPFFINI